MKKTLSITWIFLVSVFFLAACGTKSAPKAEQAKVLGLDISMGKEISNYETHSGNGDGTTCIAYSFSDDKILEQIMANSNWEEFPLEDTVQALVYGVSEKTDEEFTRVGPYLTDTDGNPLVPEIKNGYYLLTDRQTVHEPNTNIKDKMDKTSFNFSDIMYRSSFNFTLGLYDADANILYFCELDT